MADAAFWRRGLGAGGTDFEAEEDQEGAEHDAEGGVVGLGVGEVGDGALGTVRAWRGRGGGVWGGHDGFHGGEFWGGGVVECDDYEVSWL